MDSTAKVNRSLARLREVSPAARQPGVAERGFGEAAAIGLGPIEALDAAHGGGLGEAGQGSWPCGICAAVAGSCGPRASRNNLDSCTSEPSIGSSARQSKGEGAS